MVEDFGFITCSNDETIKLWSSDLEPVETMKGHTAFVFTCQSMGLGKYISGGDDNSIKIWNHSE